MELEWALLIAALIAAASAIPAAIVVLRNFLTGRRIQRGRSITLTLGGSTLELKDVSEAEQRRLIESFLTQVSGDASTQASDDTSPEETNDGAD